MANATAPDHPARMALDMLDFLAQMEKLILEKNRVRGNEVAMARAHVSAHSSMPHHC